MNKCVRWFSVLGLILLNAQVWAAVPTFQQTWVDEILSPQGAFPQRSLMDLKGKHVVFVDGLLNELAALVQNYYVDTIHEVKKMGMTYSHLRYLSSVPVSENAEKLYSDLKSIYQSYQKPIILIGHSMGGAESLYAVLNHPDLVTTGMVERAVLVEAAIGGSPLAEHVKSNLLGRAVEFSLGRGLQSLRTDVAQEVFSQVYSKFLKSVTPEQFQALSKSVYYLRGKIESPRDLSLGVRLIRSFCEVEWLEGTENDGVLTTDAQILNLEPKFGVDLGVISQDTDHIKWVVGGFWSRSKRSGDEPFRSTNRSERRYAWTRAVLSSIYPNENLDQIFMEKNKLGLLDEVAQ